jgi:hypothetical protein
MHEISASHENSGGKIKQKFAVENFCGKLLRKTAAENFYGKLLRKTSAENCGKLLRKYKIHLPDNIR